MKILLTIVIYLGLYTLLYWAVGYYTLGIHTIPPDNTYIVMILMYIWIDVLKLREIIDDLAKQIKKC